MKSNDDKYNNIIEKNTFYFYNRQFEEQYEGYITSLKDTLLNLKNEIDNQGLKKEIFNNMLIEKKNGLKALLALTGFSNESLKRLITFIRISNDEELSRITLKDKWAKNDIDQNISEWGDKTIEDMIRLNKYFRQGITNTFFEGSSVTILSKTLPLFELKKLTVQKLRFDIGDLIDTIIRYKEKGSYSGKTENNPEALLKTILTNNGINFEQGDLNELVNNEVNKKRTMDFIIPSKENPRIIVESSYLVTTSSGQGDKSKTEISVDTLIKKYYPKSHFIGFIDGIGWYVRKNDLRRMVEAYVDVFTYREDEIDRFLTFVIQVISNAR